MKTRAFFLGLSFSTLAFGTLQSLGQFIYEPYTFITLAGSATNHGSADGTGSAARFFAPEGVAVDSAGVIYVADSENYTIRKMTPAGVVTTLAGLAGNKGSADGTGSAARFFAPEGVAVDSAGVIYVADFENHTIRKVTPAGVVTTLAGLAGNRGSADGTGSAARFGRPFGVAVDSAGNVYVAESDNNTIRKVTPAGMATTLAGLAGSQGSADGIGSAARFGRPSGVAVDSAGNVYVADYDNGTIRKGLPTVGPPVVLTQPQGQKAERNPDVPVTFSVVVNGAQPMVYQWRKDGADIPGATNSSFSLLNLLASDDALYSLVATNVLGSAISASVVLTTFVRPPQITIQPLDQAEARSYPVTMAVEVTGTPPMAYQWRKDGSELAGATNANYSIAKVQGIDAGTYTVVISNPYGSVTSSNAIVTATLPYTFATLAGNAGYGSANGVGRAVRFDGPSGVAADSFGNVYVADTGNNTIRKMTPLAIVTTLAGDAGNSGSADGTGGAAQFNSPAGVAVDSVGNVYVADSGNNTIRKVTPAGMATTLAGLAGSQGSADGIGSAARFNYPCGVAVDSAGNIYVVDSGNDTIRKVTATGVVTTLAGLSGIQGSADGTGSEARFGTYVGAQLDGAIHVGPTGLAVDKAGNLYVADSANNTIRKGYPALTILSSGPGFGFKGSKFGFNLTGPDGRSVVVEASADLMSWLPIWTNTLTGALIFSDPLSGTTSSRFYRAHSQ